MLSWLCIAPNPGADRNIIMQTWTGNIQEATLKSISDYIYMHINIPLLFQIWYLSCKQHIPYGYSELRLIANVAFSD